MTRKRYRAPFWRRREPLPQHDIATLRPRDLRRGERFETIQDAQIESERSELLLTQARDPGRRIAKGLRRCRENSRQCDQPFCPLCARVFRRWFIGELLQLSQKGAGTVSSLTILLKKVGHDRIDKLDPEEYRGFLRQRLLRAGLGNAVVIGGFENVYRARQKEWVLHINLVVIGGQEATIDKFKAPFEKSKIKRALMEAPVKNAAKQLSYVLKFTTYHRPHERRGSTKGEARPLNAPEHLALVQWMSKKPFKTFLFLFNAHQSVDSIMPHQSAD
jgi:hypothetical protein